MYKSYMKNVMYFATEAKLPSCWENIVSCPSFANVIKSDITSFKTHIIVCLLKIE